MEQLCVAPPLRGGRLSADALRFSRRFYDKTTKEKSLKQSLLSVAVCATFLGFFSPAWAGIPNPNDQDLCKDGVCTFNPWKPADDGEDGDSWTVTPGWEVEPGTVTRKKPLTALKDPEVEVTETFATGDPHFEYNFYEEVGYGRLSAVWTTGNTKNGDVVNPQITVEVEEGGIWDPDIEKVYAAKDDGYFLAASSAVTNEAIQLEIFGSYLGGDSLTGHDVENFNLYEKEYSGRYTDTKVGDEYLGTNGASVNLTLKPDAQFFTRIYGGRNDDFYYEGDPTENFNSELLQKHSGDANNNSVNIQLGKGSQIALRHLIGGRSSDQLGSEFYGFNTNENQVKITYDGGDSYKPPVQLSGDQYDQINVHLGAGIYGAEGLITYRNFVNLQNVTVQNDLDGTRKIGIVGGKAWLTYYIHDGPTDTGIEFTAEEIDVDGTKEVAHEVNSGWAQGNIVLIQNSNIDLFDDTLRTKNSGPEGVPLGFYGTVKDGETNDGISIYGAYSAGGTHNNAVILENSYIDGNVYGALEFDNNIAPSREQILAADDSTDYVSLHNVTLTYDSAVYGAAKGWSNGASGGGSFESDAKVLNGRRGKVFIAGQNYASSVYAREVEFGKYLAVENGSIGQVTIKGGDESIQLGQLMGGSSIYTASGFHSSLAVQTGTDPYSSPITGSQVYGSANQVYFQANNAEKIDHNFWSKVTVYLSSKIDGDGTLNNDATDWDLNETTQKYTLQYTNAYEGSANLSLLAHDDGRMVLLGVSPGGGSDDTAVNLDWGKIGDYRVDVNDALEKAGKKLKFDGAQLQGYTTVRVVVASDNGDITKEDNSKLETYADTQTHALTFENSFTIYQTPNGSQGPAIPVAEATYQISNVLWAYTDNDAASNDQTSPWDVSADENGVINPDAEVKAGQDKGKSGEPGGIGIRYRLTGLNLLNERQLTLYGRNLIDPSESKNWEGDDIPGIGSLKPPTTTQDEDQDLFTLTAQLTGEGGIFVPQNNIVIIGGTSYLKTTDVGTNTYTGVTTVSANAYLYMNEDTALGETSYLQLMDANPENTLPPESGFTGNVKLENDMTTLGGQFFLNGHNCQQVGSLYWIFSKFLEGFS